MRHTENTTIIYKFIFEGGTSMNNTYQPTSEADYYRVMDLFHNKPEKYVLINVEYGFGFKEIKQ